MILSRAGTAKVRVDNPPELEYPSYSEIENEVVERLASSGYECYGIRYDARADDIQAYWGLCYEVKGSNIRLFVYYFDDVTAAPGVKEAAVLTFELRGEVLEYSDGGYFLIIEIPPGGSAADRESAGTIGENFEFYRTH